MELAVLRYPKAEAVNAIAKADRSSHTARDQRRIRQPYSTLGEEDFQPGRVAGCVPPRSDPADTRCNQTRRFQAPLCKHPNQLDGKAQLQVHRQDADRRAQRAVGQIVTAEHESKRMLARACSCFRQRTAVCGMQSEAPHDFLCLFTRNRISSYDQHLAGVEHLSPPQQELRPQSRAI
jgi:hypothetical protein